MKRLTSSDATAMKPTRAYRRAINPLTPNKKPRVIKGRGWVA